MYAPLQEVTTGKAGEADKQTKTLNRFLATILFALACIGTTWAQIDDYSMDGFTVTDNTFNPNRALDSLKSSHKKVPKGMHLWTIDENFGDITPQVPDTSQHLVMKTIFTEGMYGEYNTTGNLGSPRIARIATDRDFTPRDAFLEPYGYFITKPSELRFTNTLSPITNLYYNSCGNKTNGEDHLKALFATNVNKEAGFGFKFDYLYGRGYYQNQNGAYFDYTMWGSYIGQRYQAHLVLSFDHMKTSENGGIADDEYITHPEAQSDTYSANEIPTILSDNWNRNDAFHLTLSHRYNVGFHKEVPMTEEEKEAKRFAMKAKQENEAMQQTAEKAEETPSTPARRLSGRPDDAVIVGDLPNDSVRDEARKLAEQRAREVADSLIEAKKQAEADTVWTKDIYVPVTSFIHNLNFDTNTHTYIAYRTPNDYYLNHYQVQADKAWGDSIYDDTRYYTLRNRLAIALMEGLNKYVPMGVKLFAGHELRHYQLPELGTNAFGSYTEFNFTVGGQLIKTLGNTLHYKAMVETTLLGEDVGDVRIDGEGDVKFPLFKDTVDVALKAFYHLTNPTFLQRHYHSKHFWWDHDGFNKQMHTHLEGTFRLRRTATTLRVAYDNLQNYVYLAESYDRPTPSTVTNLTADVRQSSKNISLFTASLEQDFKLGPLRWENKVTLQKSSDEDIMPVPSVNVWTNLYLDFRLAKVLKVHFGADMYWFSSYYAPEYCAQLGQYAVQENQAVKAKTGNYPIVSAYLNFKLKQCRFFLMMSHINAGSGNKNYFLTPHHPINESTLRTGLVWTFNN